MQFLTNTIEDFRKYSQVESNLLCMFTGKPGIYNAKRIYLAGGWFNAEQKSRIEKIEKILYSKNLLVYSPMQHQENNYPTFSPEWRRSVFTTNHVQINNCDVILAVYDEEDSGTMWEIGFAYSIKKPIVVFREFPGYINLMIADSMHAYVEGYKQLYQYNFNQLPRIYYDGLVK